jgi:Protein of unknown function (DUF2637)
MIKMNTVAIKEGTRMNRIVLRLTARLPRRHPAAVTRRAGDGAFTVAFVALIAASASYQQQYELAIRHGQTHGVAGMLPFSVDGMIVSATLVLWYAARHGYPRPWARGGADDRGRGHRDRQPGRRRPVRVGVAGPGDQCVARGSVRRRLRDGRLAGTQPPAAWQPHPAAVSAAVPTSRQSAALITLQATITAGSPLSGGQLETRSGLSRAEATRVRNMALASANGHHPPDPGEPSEIN